jgi:hypothetical protein
MGKRLGEVAGELFVLNRVFFGEQTQIVPDCQKPLEEFPCFVPSAQDDVVVGQPEAARQEDAFPCGKPIRAFRRVVPLDEPVFYQMPLDGGDRPPDPWIADPGRKPTTGSSRSDASSCLDP